MTIVCAVRKNNRVWIGSDTSSVNNNCIFETGPKWIRVNSWMVGHSGDARVMDLLSNFENRSYSITDLTDTIRESLRKDKFTVDDEYKGGPECYGQSFLITDKEGLWHIDNVFSIVPIENYFAIGAGRDFALGAGHAVHGLSGRDQILAMLEAAMKWSVWCGGNPWVLEVE